ncbi:MAG: transcriptional repressor [Thermodesulfovibrionia bacterium]|nr:transcriptional repressor [Thermodesulfovibrionia bacterium]
METYKEIGLKLTPQRLGILEYLEGNTAHPSADDIYRDILKRFPTMSFSTVYNTLKALHKKGYILELFIDPERKRYDPETTPHHHFMCMPCKKILDIHIEYDLLIPDDQKDAFEVTRNQIAFYGICSQCKKETSSLHGS